MEERGSFQPNVDESRLHAGQHLHHFAFVNVPDKILPLGPIHVQIRHDTVVQDGHAGFFPRDADGNFLPHVRSSQSGLSPRLLRSVSCRDGNGIAPGGPTQRQRTPTPP